MKSKTSSSPKKLTSFLASLDPKMLVAVVPGALGYGASVFCPVGGRNSGDEIPFRPPSFVFGIVWPVLYALLGWSLYRSLGSAIPLAVHAALIAMLTAWIPLTSCYDRILEGVWLLLASVLTCMYAMTTDRTSVLLLLPLATWLSFATLMSAFQVTIRAGAVSPDTRPCDATVNVVSVTV